MYIYLEQTPNHPSLYRFQKEYPEIKNGGISGLFGDSIELLDCENKESVYRSQGILSTIDAGPEPPVFGTSFRWGEVCGIRSGKSMTNTALKS
jgi:hypothetical protein